MEKALKAKLNMMDKLGEFFTDHQAEIAGYTPYETAITQNTTLKVTWGTASARGTG